MGDPAVFISAKSEDYPAAQRVYEFLMAQGLSCFFSKETLLEMGEADYKDAIDQALEGAAHLVVVTSSRANAESKWVKYEWNTFSNELLSGRKTGNILTILCGGLAPGALPISLRQRQCLSFETELEKLPRFLRSPRAKPEPQPTPVILEPPVKEPAGERETDTSVKPSPQPIPQPVKKTSQSKSSEASASPPQSAPHLRPWLLGWAVLGTLIGLLHASMIAWLGSDDAVLGAGGLGGWALYTLGGWWLVRRPLAIKGLWFGWIGTIYLLVSFCQVVPHVLAMQRSSDYLVGMFCYAAVGGVLSGIAHALAFCRSGLRLWRIFAWACGSQWLIGGIIIGGFHDGGVGPDGLFYSYFLLAQVAGLGMFSWGLHREMARVMTAAGD